IVYATLRPSCTLLSSFSPYADHRDLHSFPTRRSSDLPDPDIAIGLLIDQRRRVRSRPGMPAADRLGNVETGRDLPPEGVIYLLRSEEHTSELQSRENLVCRLLLEKKKKTKNMPNM